MNTQITVDLENPSLVKILNLEAQSTGTSKKKIIISALESYFEEKLENKAINKLSESVFNEWNNSLDSDYDNL